MKKLLSTCLLIVAAAITTQAQRVNSLNFSTGYNNITGTVMPTGVQDPNWQVIFLSAPLIPAGPVPYASYTQTPWSSTPPAFGDPTTPANTQWVSYDAIGMSNSAPQDILGGRTTYEYTFETCSPDEITIDAIMRSDNYITAIRVNGTNTGFVQTNTPNSWITGDPFNYVVTLGAGVHSIQVDVKNHGISNRPTNPTGLNVDGLITSLSNSIVDRDNHPRYLCCNAAFGHCASTTNPFSVDFSADDPSQPGTYNWYINGSLSSTGPNFTNVFTPGTYTVCMVYIDNEGSSCEKCVTLCFYDKPQEDCNINYSYCGSSTNPYAIDFSITGTPTGTYTWYINGSPVGSSPNFSHVFTPGTHTICLDYTTPGGYRCQRCITLCFSDPKRKGIGSLIVETVNRNFELAKVYPNPTGAEVNVELKSPVAGTAVSIKLYDIMGKVVSEETVTLSEGQTKISISSEQLPSGVYSLYISDGRTVITDRIQVKK